MRIARHLAFACLLAGLLQQAAIAVTPLPSADGQFWDVQDTSPWAQDSGSIATGGRAHPFNGFGSLKLQVPATGEARPLRGFGLTHDTSGRVDSLTPLFEDGIVIDRELFAPPDADYLRYVDTFRNTTREARTLRIAWGGATGAFEDGGRVAVATTSSGDRRIDGADTFVTVMQNARNVDDPMRGPSGHGPSAHVLGTVPGLFTGAGDMYANPFTDAWPGYDPAHIGYVFSVSVPAGGTASLMTFVVKGLSEIYDPRGGYPIPRVDALLSTWSDPVYSGADRRVPAAGSEIARVTKVAQQLVASPDLRGLSPRQRAAIVNWRLPGTEGLPAFTVVEQSVTQLQAALTAGQATSVDVVREYLARLSRFDRHGPTYRAVLSISPRALADARARDAERAAGTVRSAFHGLPVLLKDNIDATELPTTGGARALADHRPRLDSRIAAGMKRGGAIILGKANLDEFPFGDFGISTVGGTVGNAYDASLSTAGSSGGSATAAAASLTTLAFGTDTCNSLSNPAGFASLATIRTTRGFTSRAGVMPLNTYNDAVGPMGRSIRDIALALDLVTGRDAEDPVTADADARKPASFAAGLDRASLQGKRLGAFRQRFVGITGEQEAARLIDRAIADLRAAGAVVVDVAIPDYDAVYARARGTAPGSLKAGWTTYLTRGARPGDPVLTIEQLIASGKMAPAGQRRLESALAPVPSGAELDAATARFIAAREAYRQVLVDLMNRHQLDAMIYPANVARPHTHEGGAERYGTEPGTCEESAATGLPQVTVPAGFMGGRYPVGLSLLGRMWTDQALLEMAHAYEQRTQHRRPPAGMR